MTTEQSTYEVLERRDLMVAMRDGVRPGDQCLRLPARDGRPARGQFPTVVVRTPYGKDFGSAAALPVNFVPYYGYAMAIQDGAWTLRPLKDAGGR